ncbi:MAG: F0F1 ATP synthase subunit alpha [Actinobacteria bacterium]|nr:MAG: F0F1 ATP synthase subunit alpha [Actinomycetota bacterium]
MIEETEPQLKVEEIVEIGTVVSVGDGTALVTGLKSVGSQEVVEFQNEVYGIAFTLSRDQVGCILLGPEERIQEGSPVKRTGRGLHVPVGEPLVGRIVNALGQPIDGKGPIAAHAYRLMERKAPGVVRRQPVKEPLQTGIKALDALVPLGRGQRELIIGDRKIGKTTIAIDTILAQKGVGVICVYVSIGQKASSIARVVQVLRQAGAMEYTIVVAALPNEQPSFRYLAPYAGCAIGEEFMEKGKHALIVYDDLSKHAVTYREMSALLKRPIGREAYPGDIFYIHSRLLERAAKLRDDLGGGSLTALPIVETLAGDISAFIPTNVVSICDGQIFLDGGLFNEGFRPAIDAGLSVSRVGGAAQTKAMKKVAGRLRIDMAQYQEMATFVKFGAEVDKATLAQLTRGERGRQLLVQDQHAPMSVEEETIVLYAATKGYLDRVPLDLTAEFEQAFVAHVHERHPSMLEQLQETKELSPALEHQLDTALAAFGEQFATGHPESEDVTPLVL